MILGWSVLQPSVRERRLWLAAAAALCASAIGLALAAALSDPRHPGQVWLAAATSAMAAAWSMRAGSKVFEASHEISILDDGTFMMRAIASGSNDPASTACCVFVASWLITMRCGAILVPVWPDSLPPEAFRRLHACALWAGAAGGAGGIPTDADRRNNDNDNAA